MPNNVGHAGGCPTALEGGSPSAEDLGGLGTNIIWEAVGLVV